MKEPKCLICKEEGMEGITGYDNPNSGYAFNLSMCNGCGAICKEDVWNNKGETWISAEGRVSVVKYIPGEVRKVQINGVIT